MFLTGLKVLDWTTMAAAPGATAVLADFGACVTKVESVDGDPWRRIGMKEFGADGTKRAFGPYFDHDNRGKRSVSLDLQTKAGLEAFEMLLSDSDVLVSSIRVAGQQRLGLDYESIRSRHPKLIYAHLTAWGRGGPMRDAPGYDVGAFWAASGLLDLLRASDQQKEMPRLPGAAGDHATSMSLVAGIALALYRRERTGEGSLVDVSLLRSGLWCNAMPLVAAAAAESPQKVAFMRDPLRNGPTFKAYRCRDGEYVQLLGYQTGRHTPAMLKAFSLKEPLASVEGYDAIMLTKDSAEWESIFDAAGVWYTRIVRFDRFEDLIRPSAETTSRGRMSQVAAQAAEDGAWLKGAIGQLVANPIKMGTADAKTECGISSSQVRAPLLGEHTELALTEAGASEDQLVRFSKDGAFGRKEQTSTQRTPSKL